jgi:hypothetical protein
VRRGPKLVEKTTYRVLRCWDISNLFQESSDGSVCETAIWSLQSSQHLNSKRQALFPNKCLLLETTSRGFGEGSGRVGRSVVGDYRLQLPAKRISIIERKTGFRQRRWLWERDFCGKAILLYELGCRHYLYSSGW